MKKLYFSILALTIVASFNAQVNWAVKGGLWAYDYGYGVVTDNSNNIYVAGKFEYNAIFGGYTANCQGNHDAYIVKYNSDGNIYWLKTLGGPNGDYAWGITTDGSSYFYIAGEVEGTSPIVFSNSTITLQGAGDNDVFVAKYDLDGNLMWALREGVVTSEKALSVGHDAAGNVYIAGYFTDNTNFNNTAVAGFGGHDIFVAKYNSNGVYQWMTKAGGTGRDEAKAILVDNNGNVYIAGMYTGNASFGSINMTTTDGAQDSYVAKLSQSDGSWQWVKKGNAALDDVAWSLTMDNGGSIYVTGEFNSYIDFTSSNGVPTTGATNIYVAQMDANGNANWIKTAGGPMLDRARGIGTDGTHIYVTGQFGGSAMFGTHALQAADSSDIFIAAMDNAGNFTWAFSGGGPADTREPLGYESGIAVTGRGNAVYATGGMLRDTTTAGSVAVDFAGWSLTGWSRDDMFLVSIGSNGVGLKENILSSNFSINPNPSTGIYSVDLTRLSGKATLTVYNTVGQLVQCRTVDCGKTEKLDISDCKEGVYLTELRTDDAVSRTRIVVQR